MEDYRKKMLFVLGDLDPVQTPRMEFENLVEEFSNLAIETRDKLSEFEFIELVLDKVLDEPACLRVVVDLYEQGILPVRIIQECVRKLLNTEDEEYLECFCRLLVDLGLKMLAETKQRLSRGDHAGLNDMSEYFEEMEKLVRNKKISIKVRLSMQDVIERRLVTYLPNISGEFKLKKAENAWKPGVMEKKEGIERTDMDDLKKKVLAILNKLTPKKFDILVRKFQDLSINTQDELSVCIELVFEKAVTEIAYCPVYADMCEVIKMKKVPVDGGKYGDYVNFRKLLISRCQKEFEKDYTENLDRERYVQDMAAAVNVDDKKRIMMEFEAKEMELRKRSFGNLRFIGELYKRQMLTARIIHECIKKLLVTTDDESLECLCILVTTVGQDLEAETQGRLAKGPQQGISDLGVYFKEIKKLVNEKKTSSRVRFLMQEVIELRLNRWTKRREEAGP